MMETFFSEIVQNPSVQPYLPFFFVLATVFGLLEIVNVFKKKPVNFIIALVFAFFAAGYEPFVKFFFQYFSIVLWSFVGLFFIAFFMEVFGLRESKVKKGEENVPVVMGGIILLLFITIGVHFLPELNISFLSKRDILLIAGLLLMGLMFFYAYRYEPTIKKEAAKMKSRQP